MKRDNSNSSISSEIEKWKQVLKLKAFSVTLDNGRHQPTKMVYQASLHGNCPISCFNRQVTTDEIFHKETLIASLMFFLFWWLYFWIVKKCMLLLQGQAPYNFHYTTIQSATLYLTLNTQVFLSKKRKEIVWKIQISCIAYWGDCANMSKYTTVLAKGR